MFRVIERHFVQSVVEADRVNRIYSLILIICLLNFEFQLLSNSVSFSLPQCISVA
jgi:hypothetical protein